MSDALSFPGEILREHRGDLYEVQITMGDEPRVVLARRSGRLVQNFIRIIAGDHVTVEVSPYDTKRGRIVARERLTRTG